MNPERRRLEAGPPSRKNKISPEKKGRVQQGLDYGNVAFGPEPKKNAGYRSEPAKDLNGGDEIMNINSTRAIRYATTGVLALALIIALSTLTPTAEGQEKFKETYTAVAVNMGTSNPPLIPPGTRATLQINVTRWSTEEEREFVFTELLENGAEGFVEALRKRAGSPDERAFIEMISS